MTLIELMVVLAIVGLLSAIFVPYMFRRPPARDLSAVAVELNNMAALAVQTAMLKNSVCRLTIERMPVGGVVTVEREVPVPREVRESKVITIGAGYETKFELVEPGMTGNRYELPNNVTIDNVSITKSQQEEDLKAGIYRCYVMPRGLAQRMEITLVHSNGDRLVLTMNPFSGRFETPRGPR